MLLKNNLVPNSSLRFPHSYKGTRSFFLIQSRMALTYDTSISSTFFPKRAWRSRGEEYLVVEDEEHPRGGRGVSTRRTHLTSQEQPGALIGVIEVVMKEY